MFSFAPRACALVFGLFVAAAAVAQDSDIFVNKTAPGTASVGQNITFSIIMGNSGPDDAPSAHFTDTLPADATFVSYNQDSGPMFSCSTPNPGDAGGTVMCSIATLPAGVGSNSTFSIVVNVSQSAAGTTLTNTVTAASENNDPNPEDNTSISGTSIAGGNLADVGIAKTGPSAAPPNSDVTYTITVTNFSSTNAATNVSFTDTLPNSFPAGFPMTFVNFNQTSGPTFNCGVPSTTTTCTIASFAAGAVATFQLTGHIPNGVAPGTSYTNQATLTSDNDPTSENDTSAATTTVSSVDVGVTKSGPATAQAGGPTFNYVVVVSNGGPDVAENVTFNDVLPAGINFVSLVQDTGPAANCAMPAPDTNGTVTCSIPTLGNGQSAQFTITVQAQPTVANGTMVNNTATVTTSSADTNPNNDSSTASTTISAQADVAISKSAPATANAGTNITYNISVANNGPSAAANLQWTDTLPSFTTFVSELQTTGPLFNCTTGATINCSIASLAPGATATFSVTVQISPATPNGTSISNTVNVSTTTPDATPGNNSSTASTTISSVADLAVTKSGPATAQAGTDITYTINVQNNGPSNASSVTLTDVLPANTTFVSENQTNGPAFNCTTGATISCSIALFAPGASATFSVTVHISPATANGSSISNTANVGSTTADATPANNSSTASTTVSSVADLAVTKSGPATAQAGTDVTYTINVQNNGPSNASSVTLTDVLPPNTTFVSENQTTGPAFNCTTGATVTCSIASFATGASASFSITAHFSGSLTNGTTVTNTATVSSTTSDSNPANNSSSASTIVGANADLSVTKSGPAATPSNVNVTYTVNIANAGPSNAANATLTESVPANMTFVSANQTSGPAFSCSGTGPITCTIASFAAGSSASFQFTFFVSSAVPAGTTTSNTATISSATPDLNPANNSATVSTTIGESIPALSDLALGLLALTLAGIALMIVRR